MIAVDTNILIYAVGDEDKRYAAIEIIARCAAAGGLIPLQVLAEFANVCRRKRVLDAEHVALRIAEFSDVFATPATSSRNIAVAIGLAERYQLSFFDALICAIARDAGASALFSEDMHDGLRIDRLEIINPLRAENIDRIDRLLPR